MGGQQWPPTSCVGGFVAKPQAIEVPSDDCLVTVGGEKIAVHEGESVTLLPGMSVGAISAANTLMSLGPKLAAAEGEPDQVQQQTALADDAMTRLCASLAPRIVSWTWTDMAGRPLPQPDGTAGPLMALEVEELIWLLGAAKGETAAPRKNG